MNKNKAITCQISLFTRKPLIFYDNVLGFNLKMAANKVNWSVGYKVNWSLGYRVNWSLGYRINWSLGYRKSHNIL